MERLIMDKLLKDNRQLTVEEIIALWSKTYSSEGTPDWSHLFPYYHKKIIFKDPIQTVKGKAKFKKMCNRLSRRCKSLDMEILTIVQDKNTVMMEWKMTMAFRKFPTQPIYGSTRLTFNSQGYIVEQRDYYDLWGDIFNGVPVFRTVYHLFMKAFFG